MSDGNGAGFHQRLEAFLQIDVLAGADGRIHRRLQLDPLVRELPGNHVLVPGQGVPVQRLSDANAVLHAHVPEVV